MLRYGLMLVAGGFALLNAVEVVRVLENTLPSTAIPSWLRIGFSLLWTVAFAWSGLKLMRNHSNGQSRIFWTVSGFAVYVVLRLLIFAQADYDRQRLPFLAICLCVLLIFIGIVRLLSARTKKVEHSSYDS